MAITYKGSRFTTIWKPAFPAGITDYVVARPAGTQVDDLLICALWIYFTDHVDVAAGWHRVGNVAEDPRSLHLFWKWAEADDPATWTWHNLDSDHAALLACIARYRGGIDLATPVTPLDNYGGTFGNGVNTVFTENGENLAADRKAFVFSASRQNGGVWTHADPHGASAYTKRTDLFSGPGPAMPGSYNLARYLMLMDRDTPTSGPPQVEYDAPLAGGFGELNFWQTAFINPGPEPVDPPSVAGVLPQQTRASGHLTHIIASDDGEAI